MFNLTKQERLVFTALFFILLAGSTLSYILKKFPHLDNIVNFIDREVPVVKVDINTATKEQLISVPYVGEVRAQKIMDYRKQYGPFEKKERLKNVLGIGPKTFKRMAPFIRTK